MQNVTTTVSQTHHRKEINIELLNSPAIKKVIGPSLRTVASQKVDISQHVVQTVVSYKQQNRLTCNILCTPYVFVAIFAQRLYKPSPDPDELFIQQTSEKRTILYNKLPTIQPVQATAKPRVPLSNMLR